MVKSRALNNLGEASFTDLRHIATRKKHSKFVRLSGKVLKCTGLVLSGTFIEALGCQIDTFDREICLPAIKLCALVLI